MTNFIKNNLRPAALVVASLAVAMATGCASKPSLGQMRTKADVALDRNDYAEAARWYEQIAERRPGYADVRFHQGQAYLGMNEPYKARESFEMAADLEPENMAYRQALVDTLISLGDTDEVFAVLDRDEMQALEVDAALARGDAALELGLADEAERSYKLAASWAEREDPRPHAKLAELYRSIGDRLREIERLRVLLYLDADKEAVESRLRELGEIPGPSLQMRPEDL